MYLLIPISLFILLSFGLTGYFLRRDRMAREPKSALWKAFGLGFLGAIIASYLEGIFIPDQYLTRIHGIHGPLLVAALGVGLIEEACKFLPAALFLYGKPFFNEHTDGIIYFAIAGLGFGLPENILYTLQFGVGAGLARLILTPFFHAALTAVVGYFLIEAKLHERGLRTVVLALAGMTVVHGLYDFGIFSQVPVMIFISVGITFFMTGMLFRLFHRAVLSDQRSGWALQAAIAAPPAPVAVPAQAPDMPIQPVAMPAGQLPAVSPAANKVAQGFGALATAILSVPASIVPLAGLVLGIAGIIMGRRVLRRGYGLGWAAVILGCIGIIFALLSAFINAVSLIGST